MIQKITTINDPNGEAILSKVAEQVDVQNKPYMAALVADLADTAHSCQKPLALGLAAHQIGRPVRAFVIKEGKKFKAIINPEVLETSARRKVSNENCLSFPGKPAIRVMRHREIKIRFYNPHTEEMQTRTFSKIKAVIVQHELDHLDGKLV